jgi:hypothetical protein
MLSLWLLAALGVAWIYPGRAVADLAWALVPLWGLAGLGVAGLLGGTRPTPIAGVLAGVTLVFLAFFWINLRGLVEMPVQGEVARLRWLMLGGAVAMIAAVTSLVGLGWSFKDAQVGLSWGMALVLGLFTLAATFRPLRAAPSGVVSLWRSFPEVKQESLLLDSLGDLGEWYHGRRDALDIVVVGVDSAAVQWALRGYPYVRSVADLGRDALPEVILQPQSAGEPERRAIYRGQDFIWRVYPISTGISSGEFLRWITRQEMLTQEEVIILWARGDLFPGGVLSQEPETSEEVIPLEEPLVIPEGPGE